MNNIETRDYFAGLAMQELLRALGTEGPLSVIVEGSYAVADAMMEEREKGK